MTQSKLKNMSSLSSIPSTLFVLDKIEQDEDYISFTFRVAGAATEDRIPAWRLGGAVRVSLEGRLGACTPSQVAALIRKASQRLREELNAARILQKEDS